MSSTLPASEQNADSYLRFPEVKFRTGLSRTTIHRLIKDGDFPCPKKLGKRAVGWLSSDVARWREARPEARTPAKAA